MFSHLWGMRLAAIVAAAASLSACRTFSPDGGMDTVAMVAGTGLNKDVVQIRSAEDQAAVRTRVTRLLHRPLSADAAVQIALLNNLGLQAAYNRLGIAEALAVKASRPPSLTFDTWYTSPGLRGASSLAGGRSTSPCTPTVLQCTTRRTPARADWDTSSPTAVALTAR